ncbi:Uncharacterized protein APZ42_006643, partial [Daphnia magna]
GGVVTWSRIELWSFSVVRRSSISGRVVFGLLHCVVLRGLSGIIRSGSVVLWCLGVVALFGICGVVNRSFGVVTRSQIFWSLGVGCRSSIGCVIAGLGVVRWRNRGVIRRSRVVLWSLGVVCGLTVVRLGSSSVVSRSYVVLSYFRCGVVCNSGGGVAGLSIVLGSSVVLRCLCC